MPRNRAQRAAGRAEGPHVRGDRDRAGPLHYGGRHADPPGRDARNQGEGEGERERERAAVVVVFVLLTRNCHKISSQIVKLKKPLLLVRKKKSSDDKPLPVEAEVSERERERKKRHVLTLIHTATGDHHREIPVQRISEDNHARKALKK